MRNQPVPHEALISVIDLHIPETRQLLHCKAVLLDVAFPDRRTITVPGTPAGQRFVVLRTRMIMGNAVRELRQLFLPASPRGDKQLLQFQRAVRRNGKIVAVDDKFNGFPVEADLVGEAPAAGESGQFRGSPVREKLDQVVDGEHTGTDGKTVMKTVCINRGLNLSDGSPVLGEHIGAFRIKAGVRRIPHRLPVNHHFPQDRRLSGCILQVKGMDTPVFHFYQFQTVCMPGASDDFKLGFIQIQHCILPLLSND